MGLSSGGLGAEAVSWSLEHEGVEWKLGAGTWWGLQRRQSWEEDRSAVSGMAQGQQQVVQLLFV